MMILMDLMGLKALMTLIDLMELISLKLLIDLHGCMARHGIAVYGYLALWLHDCIAIKLDDYVAIQLCHGMTVYG